LKSAEAHKVSKGSRSDSSANKNPGAEVCPRQSRKLTGAARRNLITVTIIGGVVVGALVIGGQATKPQLTGDTISQTFAQGDPCATATIPLATPQGADPTATAKTVFAALTPLQGLTTGTYNWRTSNLEIGFCESKSSESAIRQALAPTGLVAQSGAAQGLAPSAETPIQ
jgi:hypothetical protein